MLCDIAPDRLHHVFWQYYDERHPLYEAGNRYENVFQDYYRFLDRQLADFLELVPEDAVTIVMSDHGARPMMGGLCFNDWLIQEDYLTLTEPAIGGPVPIKDASIDWSRTVAWGDGGYYGRLFLNVKGREPQGVVEPAALRGHARRAHRQARGPGRVRTASRWARRCSSRRTSTPRSAASRPT